MTRTQIFQRMTRRQASFLVSVLLASGVSMGACSKQSKTAGDTWEDVAAATGPGQVLVKNRSDQTITRLWFSPSHVEGLWPGATPEGFEALEPGASFQQEIPMGWWDVWFESADGSDTLLYRTWFGNNEATEFIVESSWWILGDWIEETETPDPGTPNDRVVE